MKLVCILNDPHRFSKLHFFTPNKSYHFVSIDTSSSVVTIQTDGELANQQVIIDLIIQYDINCVS